MEIDRRRGLPTPVVTNHKGIPALHECGFCGAASNPDDPNGHVHTFDDAGLPVVGKRRDVEKAQRAKHKAMDAARAAELADESASGPLATTRDGLALTPLGSDHAPRGDPGQ